MHVSIVILHLTTLYHRTGYTIKNTGANLGGKGLTRGRSFPGAIDYILLYFLR